MTQENTNKAMDIKQAAKYLGVTVWRLRDAAQAGEVTCFKGLSRGYSFEAADLDAWRESRRVQAKGAAPTVEIQNPLATNTGAQV